MAGKYKTHTSSEVKVRYNRKTYKQYAITLRIDTDQDYIDFFEEQKKAGYTVTDAVKKMIRETSEE